MYRGRKRTILTYLQDISNAISQIRDFIGPMDIKDFSDDLKTLLAVVKSVENISEATKKIPQNIKKQYSNVPWQKIINIRNRVVHEYFAVKPENVWRIVKNDLRTLEAAVADISEKVKNNQFVIIDSEEERFRNIINAIKSCDVDLIRMVLHVNRSNAEFLRMKDSDGHTPLRLAIKLEFGEQNPGRAEGYRTIIQYLKDAEAGKKIGADAEPQSSNKDIGQKSGSNDSNYDSTP